MSVTRENYPTFTTTEKLEHDKKKRDFHTHSEENLASEHTTQLFNPEFLNQNWNKLTTPENSASLLISKLHSTHLHEEVKAVKVDRSNEDPSYVHYAETLLSPEMQNDIPYRKHLEKITRKRSFVAELLLLIQMITATEQPVEKNMFEEWMKMPKIEQKLALKKQWIEFEMGILEKKREKYENLEISGTCEENEEYDIWDLYIDVIAEQVVNMVFMGLGLYLVSCLLNFRLSHYMGM